MTFWLYGPSQFFKSSTLVPHRSQDLGDVLNFLTLFILSLSVYLQRKFGNQVCKKVLMIGMAFILTLSLFTSSQSSQVEMIDDMEVPKYNDYQYSLSVD